MNRDERKTGRRASARSGSTSGQPKPKKGNRRLAKKVPLISRLPRLPVRRWAAAIIGPAKGRMLRALAAGGVAAAAVVGIGAGWQAITRSPSFALEDVVISGLVRANEDEIRALSGVRAGDNLVALDTDEVARAIEKHPWVAGARVIRRLPRGVGIEVTEHQPVALVALEHLYYVDGEGVVVKRLAPGETDELPIITGLSREDVEASDALALAQIRAALQFDEAWNRARPGQPLDEIHVGPSGTIAVSLRGATEDASVRVHLGPAPWDLAIARYDEIVADVAARGVIPLEIAAYSERRPDRAVVRIAAAAPASARGTAASQDSKSKKKN